MIQHEVDEMREKNEDLSKRVKDLESYHRKAEEITIMQINHEELKPGITEDKNDGAKYSSWWFRPTRHTRTNCTGHKHTCVHKDAMYLTGLQGATVMEYIVFDTGEEERNYFTFDREKLSEHPNGRIQASGATGKDSLLHLYFGVDPINLPAPECGEENYGTTGKVAPGLYISLSTYENCGYGKGCHGAMKTWPSHPNLYPYGAFSVECYPGGENYQLFDQLEGRSALAAAAATASGAPAVDGAAALRSGG